MAMSGVYGGHRRWPWYCAARLRLPNPLVGGVHCASGDPGAEDSTTDDRVISWGEVPCIAELFVPNEVYGMTWKSV
ncbi:hypothetical protein MRX96_015730 [Rhipicephalus microplus]